MRELFVSHKERKSLEILLICRSSWQHGGRIYNLEIEGGETDVKSLQKTLNVTRFSFYLM